LRLGHYSSWFRDHIKDEPLAHEVQQVEGDPSVNSKSSRELVRQAIESRYTLPA
jgi:hypothetical protein